MIKVLKDLQLTTNFKLSEFRCKDGGEVLIDNMRDINRLQYFRTFLQQPITITSAYRNEEYNKLVGGVPNSQHIYGRAYDITCEPEHRMKLIDLVLKSGFNGIGIYDDFIHVDSRDTKAFWNDSKLYGGIYIDQKTIINQD